MSSTAEDYAKRVAEGFWEASASGYPFGRTECPECSAYPEDACTGEDCPEREPADAYAYLEGALDIDYVVSGDGDYRGAEILISFGGPNATIDTRSHELVVTWWSAPVRERIPADMCDQLDDALSELWVAR